MRSPPRQSTDDGDFVRQHLRRVVDHVYGLATGLSIGEERIHRAVDGAIKTAFKDTRPKDVDTPGMLHIEHAYRAIERERASAASGGLRRRGD